MEGVRGGENGRPLGRAMSSLVYAGLPLTFICLSLLFYELRGQQVALGVQARAELGGERGEEPAKGREGAGGLCLGEIQTAGKGR